MTTKINGRTPEEIKKGLECCSENADGCDCEGCPYDLGEFTCQCIPANQKDALALIQQLENHIGELTEMVQQLERERDAAVEAQSKWISVEERLPEESFEVLMLFKHNMAAGWYGGEGDWYSNTDDGFYASCDGEPTHWMPLPEPPKEET